MNFILYADCVKSPRQIFMPWLFFGSTNGISSTSCNEVLESQIQQKIAIYFNV